MMNKHYLTRSESRAWSSELPVGDAFGGAAYGERRDPVTAIAGSGLISAGLGISAAHSQERAAEKGLNAQQKMFNTIREDTGPTRMAGNEAIYRLRDLFRLGNGLTYEQQQELDKLQALEQKYGATNAPGAPGQVPMLRLGANPTGAGPYAAGFGVGNNNKNFTPEQVARLNELRGMVSSHTPVDPSSILQNIPGYQFRLDQGLKALEGNQAANRIGGGRAIKEAIRYGQNFGSQEYGNYAESLFRLAGYGGNAINTSASSAPNYGQLYGNIGAAGAAGPSAINNAIQGGIGNYTTLTMYNDMMKRLAPTG